MSDASPQRARIYAFRIRIFDRASRKWGQNPRASASTREHSLQGKILSLKIRARIESQKPRASASAVFRPSPYLGKDKAIRSKTATNQGKWVSSPRVPFPREISTRGARSQVLVPPSHVPVQPSREFYETWMGREPSPIYKGGNPQRRSQPTTSPQSLSHLPFYIGTL